MRKITAAVTGVLVAPLVPATVVALGMPITGDSWDIVNRVVMIPFFYGYSVAAAMLLGVPIFLLFLRFGLLRWWSTIAAGIAIGAAVAFIVFSHLTVSGLIIMALHGGVSAFVFWLIWRLGCEPEEQKFPRANQ